MKRRKLFKRVKKKDEERKEELTGKQVWVRKSWRWRKEDNLLVNLL